MSSDAVIHLMPRVHDERIKTGMSAALCFYEKTAGKVRNILTDRGIEAKQENPMSKMAAHMGIVMNTAIDATDSHIAQMVIEGSTMSITEVHCLARIRVPPLPCAARPRRGSPAPFFRGAFYRNCFMFWMFLSSNSAMSLK